MSTAAFAQTNLDVGNYMIGYYTGANQGLPDAQMHIVNPGSNGGYGTASNSPSATPAGGDLCANIYVFTSDEQMIACCSCKVSPNGMQGFSLATDLVGNPLTGIVPHAGAIKVIASAGGGPPGSLGTPPPGPGTSAVSGLACDAGSDYATPLRQIATPLQLQTWITHVRPLGTPFGAADAVTEIPFSGVALSPSELTKVQNQCFAIEAADGLGGVGSGAGKCICDPAKAT
jgi:hypothetical protein